MGLFVFLHKTFEKQAVAGHRAAGLLACSIIEMNSTRTADLWYSTPSPPSIIPPPKHTDAIDMLSRGPTCAAVAVHVFIVHRIT